MRIWTLVLAITLGLTGLNAEAAKRMGSGRSVGQQSSNVTQREAVRPPPTAPAQNASNAAAKPATAAPPAAQPAAPKRPWGAMLGGLAAGLGLAWLASSLGLGGMASMVGQFLLFALLAFGVMAAIGWFMRKRKPEANVASASSPFAFQGAGATPVVPAQPYRPENVGNDASARPWERSSMAFEATPSSSGGSMIGSALMGSQTWGVPEGFDSVGFLKAAKTNFVTLQSAWDRSDIPALRAMMTDGMLREIQSQLAEREAHTGGSANQTEVVMIEASLLGIEELATEYMASVEFTGMIREDVSAGPNPFREVWNMTKPKAGGGWLVAGVQALQ
ncbi:Tim44 domain-containing protein [Rhodoferax aquaticus]|uniref:Tim44 domain-containing protein n=1 Tax=Rhodoferax aquaticus TaxID=2527691 RepID=A0A515EM58_9BURK|nr:TIM44-like domain-containing protein [Rhodoferax aquaticus]QDL53741.1 Tim44 domain-containing protein [Rhodoferax aquaticus]